MSMQHTTKTAITLNSWHLVIEMFFSKYYNTARIEKFEISKITSLSKKRLGTCYDISIATVLRVVRISPHNSEIEIGLKLQSKFVLKEGYHLSSSFVICVLKSGFRTVFYSWNI